MSLGSKNRELTGSKLVNQGLLEFKKYFESRNYALRGSGVEVLLGNEKININDLDLQLIISAGDEQKVDVLLNKMQKDGYSIHKENNQKFIVSNSTYCFDIHILYDEGDFYIEHRAGGTFYFPKDGYGMSVGVRYLLPEISLLMSLGSPSSEKNTQRTQRLKRIVNENIFKILGDRFEYKKPAHTSH